MYQAHPGSWMRVPEESHRRLTWLEMAPKLAEHVRRMGFTHVELTGAIAHNFTPDPQHGPPEGLMHLVNLLHRSGIGVILEWPVWRLLKHQSLYDDWRLLITEALFWLDAYHADGLRVGALDSTLLHLSQEIASASGRHQPGPAAGTLHERRSGLDADDSGFQPDSPDAITLFRRLNEEVYAEYPDVLMIASGCGSWPLISHLTSAGGLGFRLKWDDAWAYDTLAYLSNDPLYRKYHHELITSRLSRLLGALRASSSQRSGAAGGAFAARADAG